MVFRMPHEANSAITDNNNAGFLQFKYFYFSFIYRKLVSAFKNSKLVREIQKEHKVQLYSASPII